MQKHTGIFFCILLACFKTFAKDSVAYQNPLSNFKFLSSELHIIENSRAWRKLLHIERNAIGIFHRQIPDNSFYLSNNSIYKSTNELTATLASFLEPSANYEKLIPPPTSAFKNNAPFVVDHSQHPICRFPARFKFLKSQLGTYLDYWNNLPSVNCVFQQIFLTALDAQSVSFVFSSYYADSPGSAFGHTFFRINRSSNSNFKRQELLDYGVGYAAYVDIKNPVLYALMGLFGGFNGTWTNLPYYYKVREYNDFEARDLWSYDLNLTADEVQMLTLHLWEVGAHYYTYYFFTQNCAYHMLTVLEAAAPRLHLSDKVPFYYVIPSDSLKSIFLDASLVKNTHFRPSLRKVFEARLKLLDDQALSVFQNYVASPSEIQNLIAPLNESQKALLVDAAIDLYDLDYPEIQLQKNESLNMEKENLLNLRASLIEKSPDLDLNYSVNELPERAHGSSRVGIILRNSNSVQTGFLQYRFALHDLQDPIDGLPPHSQLEFFNFSFSLKENKPALYDLSVFKILNLNPIKFYKKNASWGLEFGLQNKENFCNTNECHLYGLLAKYGAALEISSINSLAWGLGTANLRYGPQLKSSSTYVALGFELGGLVRFGTNQSVQAKFFREFSENRTFYEETDLSWAYSPIQNIRFGLGLGNDSYKALMYVYY